jgi:hypothetical protein
MLQNVITFICGRKGTGKTTIANKLAQKAFLSRRVIVIAPMKGFFLRGVPKYSDFTDHEAGLLRGRSLILEPQDDGAALNLINFTWLTQENASAPLWLFIDEVDLYLSWQNPDPVLLKIIRYGRHRRISLVGVTQRPANVHKDLVAQADVKILFNTAEPNDLAYLRKYANVEPAVLQALRIGEYLRL